MSARRKQNVKRKRGTAPPKTPSSGKKRQGPTPATRAATVLIGVGLLVVAGLWWSTRGPATTPRPDRPPTIDTLPIAAIIDSQSAAVDEQRWAASVGWADLLARREPNDPMRMLGVGMALHNWAWGGSGTGRARTATRTSLDRVRMEKRALAVLDSAVAFARTPDEAARLLHWMGQIHEIYGLPVEAALGYQEALLNEPSFELSVPRATWVMKRLRDPLGDQ